MTRHILFGFAYLTITLSLSLAQTPSGWDVPAATLCVDVHVQRDPDHPDLGVFVKIPDGGLLPGKHPVPEARDAQGKPLESLIVGYHPADGLGVLFARPADGDTARIYIRGSATPPPKPDNPRLIPSVLYFTKNGNASLETAKRMAKEYPPAQGAFFSTWSCIGSMVNPFGPDDDFSSWYVGCILLEKSEKIYFATVSDEGSEFWIDGKLIHSWPGIHTRDGGAKGQRGDHVELSAGLHRIDYYHFEARGKQEAQLTWRRKGVTEGPVPELVTGFARSGEGAIRRIALKDGRVCAVIKGNTEPNGYFWTGDQPLSLFTLNYTGLDHTEPALSVAWEFEKNKRISEPIIEWLVSGDPDLVTPTVTLAVSNAHGVARTSTRLVCPWTPPQLSLDSSGDRLNFRKAFFNMLRAVPKPGDPCADWKTDHWDILIELLEPYRAGPILYEIFTRAFDTLQKRPPEQRWALEDRFIETLRLQRDDRQLLDWISRLEANERNNSRKFRWKDERVCAYLYDINDLVAAKREVVFLKEAAIAPDQTQIAALRQGDLERALGNTEAAVKFYKDAQERYRSRNKIGMAGGRMAYVGPRRRAAAETNAVDSAASKRPKMQSLASQKKIDDWKIYTVHNASMYSTIMTYLSQDAVPEALQKLNDWENESPASKLSGEYPLAEARIYIHVEDLRRAVNALSTYRKSVTMSAQLADAMNLEIECLQRMNNKKQIKEVAEDFLKRFPGHPFEERMKEALAQ